MGILRWKFSVMVKLNSVYAIQNTTIPPQSNGIAEKMIQTVKIDLKAFSPLNQNTEAYNPNLLLSYRVTLCRWPAKQTIPLSVLARNQTKGLGLEISPWPEVEGDARRESDKGARRSWRRDTDRGSRQRKPERWDQSEEMGSRPVKEDRVKMSRHSSCFVEVSLVIHASVSLYMLSEMQCYITPCLALWVNPNHIVRLFFLLSSRSLDCIFDVAVEKCALPLSGPLVDHRPRRGMVKRSWYNVWAEAVSSQSNGSSCG